MKKFTKILVILGIVLCLCGSAVTAAGYLGGGFRELSGRVSPRVTAVSSVQGQENLTVSSVQGQENLTFSPEEIDRLEFRLSSEDIVFRPSEDGKIHIRYLKREDVTYTAYTEQNAASDQGSTLIFSRSATGHSSQLFHFGFNFESDTPDVQVALPKGLSLDILTASGDVALSSLSVSDLSVSTVSGDLDLSQVQAESLSLDSTSGDMELENVTVSGETNLETTSGETELEHCALNAAVSFSSVSGDLSGQAVITGDLRLSTTSGDLTLDLTGSPAHSAGEISTTSGDLNLPFLQPQATYLIHISTVSGDVNIYGN